MISSALLSPREQAPVSRRGLLLGGMVFATALVLSYSRGSLVNALVFPVPRAGGIWRAVHLAPVRRIPAGAGPVLRSQHAGQLLCVLPGDDRGRTAFAARASSGFAARAAAGRDGVRYRPGAFLLARLFGQCLGGYRGPDLFEPAPHPVGQIVPGFGGRRAGRRAGAARTASVVHSRIRRRLL